MEKNWLRTYYFQQQLVWLITRAISEATSSVFVTSRCGISSRIVVNCSTTTPRIMKYFRQSILNIFLMPAKREFSDSVFLCTHLTNLWYLAGFQEFPFIFPLARMTSMHTLDPWYPSGVLKFPFIFRRGARFYWTHHCKENDSVHLLFAYLSPLENVVTLSTESG